MIRTAASGAVALVVLGTAACETSGATGAPDPAPAAPAPATPTVGSRPELIPDHRPQNTTFYAHCGADGRVINYWPETQAAWERAVAECRN